MPIDRAARIDAVSVEQASRHWRAAAACSRSPSENRYPPSSRRWRSRSCCRRVVPRFFGVRAACAPGSSPRSAVGPQRQMLAHWPELPLAAAPVGRPLLESQPHVEWKDEGRPVVGLRAMRRDAVGRHRSASVWRRPRLWDGWTGMPAHNRCTGQPLGRLALIQRNSPPPCTQRPTAPDTPIPATRRGKQDGSRVVMRSPRRRSSPPSPLR